MRLGTPATRAATIEGLVKHGFCKREGKKILATEKGQDLISVVPEEVKSPKLTADWEMKLQKIEHGQYSADSFMSEIEGFVKELCGNYNSVDPNSKFRSGKFEALGLCPKCKGEVIKGKYGPYCKNKCGMNVAKVYGHLLTDLQIKGLLSGKSCSFKANNKTTNVFPEVVTNEYQGKTYYQWATKKGN